ncbi:MAG: SRPBCC family protein [Dehalococcoidia bacterium]
MPSVSFTGIIARPVGEVFAFVTDVTKHPSWQKGVVDASLVSGGPVGVGSMGQEIRRFMGKRVETTYRVTVFEPEKRFQTESVTGPVPGEIGAEFEALDEGSTRVTLSAAFHLEGVLKMAGPFARRTLRKETEQSFESLKALLERG